MGMAQDDNGTKQHDHDDGDNDDEIGVSSDDMDGKKQHRDDNTATASSSYQWCEAANGDDSGVDSDAEEA